MGSAMTIGVFDGLHLGHQALINKIVLRGPNPTVVTFAENPKKIVSPQNFRGDLFSLKQKQTVIEGMGVSRLILIDFSEEFSKLNGRDFLDLLEEKGKMAFLAIGSNFRCGFRQDTDAEYIAERNRRKGIPTEVVSPVTMPPEFGSKPVNSSWIRTAVAAGDMKTAAALMGRNFVLDLSDMDSDGQVYDTRSVRRIVPAGGQYPVLVNSGGMSAMAFIENGKLKLGPFESPGNKAFDPALPVLSLEFI